MIKNKKNGMTVLVIEDERSLLEVVTTKLENSGFSVIGSRSVEQAFSAPLEKDADGVVSISSVEAALRHIESLESVDAIWLDHNLLGKEDGLDFVTKFKANGGRWSGLPIFVVSNNADSELIKAYSALGAKKYYIKAEHRLDAIVADLSEELADKNNKKSK